MGEDLANLEPFCVTNIGETDLLSLQWTIQEIVVALWYNVNTKYPITFLCAEGFGQ